ncbi:MAG: ribose 5-phosphate isomerase B [Planctomycetota bacterium]|nr:ribose 5-phosphate isomerase B [Planctomycetota bacterium]
MRIALAADHGGYQLKEELKKHLAATGMQFLDFGTDTEASCDYPDYGKLAARAVAEADADFGVVICKSGVGMSIVANKVKGVRCGTCHTTTDAELARRHNHANVLSLAANKVSPQLAAQILNAFVTTEPEGGRHKRRVDKITRLEL